MTLYRAIAYCQNHDSWESGQIAAAQVAHQIGSAPDVLMLFTTIQHDLPRLLDGIRSQFPHVPIVGCTGLGLITQKGGDHAKSAIGLMGLKSDSIKFQPFLFAELSQDPHQVGQNLGQVVTQADVTAPAAKLLFLFHNPFATDCMQLFAGMKAVFPAHVDVVGGAAGHDYYAEKTAQFWDVDGERQITDDGISGLLISGSFTYQIGISHGSQPIGEFRTVTQAEGTRIHTIDHQPAIELIKSLLGADRLDDFEQMANSVVLAVPFTGQDYSEDTLLRGILGVDEAQGSILVSNPMSVGTQFQITRRNPDRVLQGTKAMATHLTRQLASPQEALYLYFNCDGRGAYLFGDPEPDVAALQSVIGPDCDLFGYFCFAETAPVAQVNTFHAYTGVLVALEA
jgi:small ligand-binding sensory domain FIST